MEVYVSRLLQPSVSAIHSLAFSDKEDLLAVGLSDGSIQLLCASTWAVKCVIPGCEGERSVRRLCFVEGRLFSTGVHGQVNEWSTDTGKEMGSYPSNGGAIWDMAVDEEKKLLAVSTESGAIPIYSLGPSGSTTLTRLGELKGEYQAAKKKGGGGGGSTRALSVCFGIAKDGDTSYRTVYAGNDRGIISEWRLELKGGDDGSLSLGNTVCVSDSMRILPHTNVGGGILVWTLKALSNDRIVSGDSSGCLTVWDVDKHVQLQRIREHQADILCMTVRRSSANHDLAIFTTGVDAKISKFAETTNGELSVKTSYFVNRRDANAISLHPQREILVCGGNDGQLVITSTKAQFTPVKLPHFHGLASSPAGGGVVRCSSSRRLVLTVWRNSMKIWYIPDGNSSASIAGSSESLDMLTNGVGLDTPTRINKPICLQEVALSSAAHIVASDMTNDGEVIACCTADGGVRIFSFALDELELSKLAVVADLTSVTALCLDQVSEGSTICYAADSDTGRIQLVDTAASPVEHIPWGSPFRGVVTRMALSPLMKNGSKCLVVADSYGDVHCMGISSRSSEPTFCRTCCLPSHRRSKKAKRRIGAIENRSTGKIFATSITFSTDGSLCFVTSSSSMLYCFKIGPKTFDLLWHVDIRSNINQGHRQHTKGAVAESLVEIPGQIFHTVQVTSVEAKTKQGSPTSVKVLLFADSLILAGDIKCRESPVSAAFTVVKSRFSDDTESKRWMGSHILGCAQLDERDWLHGLTDTLPSGVTEAGTSPKKYRRRANSTASADGRASAVAGVDRSLVLCSVIDQADIDQQLPPAFDRKRFYR